MSMRSQFSDMTSSSIFFDVVLFFLSSLVTSLALELCQFFFYKGLIRNREIGNTHIWVLQNIWRLGRVKGTKFGTNVSLKKCYWMLQSARFTAFTVFELLKENQEGGGGRNLTPPTQIRVKQVPFFTFWIVLKAFPVFELYFIFVNTVSYVS